MQRKKITCIICPVGCDIVVRGDKDKKDIYEISGYKCNRGKQYARDEFLNPVRILTTTVKARDYYLPVVSVRSSKPIPKHLIFECMNILKKVELQAPFKMGKVVVKNILDTGADIITTKC